MRQYYVYLLASKKNGTLYIGVTNDLVRRAYEHRESLVKGFVKKYKVHRLVYYEVFGGMYNAISREKRLKKFSRAQKINLIKRTNREWRDLFDEISG